MSKNLTRKGLAIGAVVALGSTLIAGSPALAVDPVSLTPTTGSSYNTLLTENLQLSTVFTDAAQQGSEMVKFVITDSSKKLDITSGTKEGTSNYAVDTATSGSGTDLNLVAGDGIYVVEGGTTTGPAASVLTLVPDSSATSTFSVDVQAWLDFDDNNKIDAGEAATIVRTVKFVKASEVATTLNLTQPTEGDTTATVNFVLNDINNEQLTASEFGVEIKDANGATLAGASGNEIVVDQAVTDGEVAIVYDATDKRFEGTSAAFTAIAKSTGIRARVYFENGVTSAAISTSTGTAVGAAVTLAAGTRKVALFTAAVVRSATAAAVTASTNHVLRNSTFQLKATATDSSTPAKKVAGVAVSVTVTVPTGSLSSTTGAVKSLTINGTTYTDEAKLPGATGVAKLATTTDATGAAIVSFTTVGFAVWDSVQAVFAAENFSSTVLVASQDASYTAYIAEDNALTGASSANSNVTILEGSTVPVTVEVRDQFGGVPADKFDARVVITTIDTARTTDSTSAASVSAAVVAGKAVVNLVDKGKGAGTDVYTVYVNERAAGGGFVADGSDAISNNTVDEINVIVVSNVTAGKITVTSENAAKNTAGAYVAVGSGTLASPEKFALELADFGSYDQRAVLGTEPELSNGVNLVGAIQTAAGTAIAGAPLTITGAGLQFSAGAGSAYGLASLTIRTGSTGNYDVYVSSNNTGKKTITLTSGAFSQTVEVTFVDSAAEDTATALTIDAPVSILPGRTLTVAGLLVDEFGNGVLTVVGNPGRFTLSYDGPGLPIATLPSDTDKDGKFSFKVLLGAADTGSAVVTAKYDSNLDGDYTDTDDLTTVKTITIGAAAVVVVAPKLAVIATKNGRVYVTVNYAAGFKAYVKVGFSVKPAFKTTGSKLVSYYVGAGKRVAVRVYVRGGIAASQAITIK